MIEESRGADRFRDRIVGLGLGLMLVGLLVPFPSGYSAGVYLFGTTACGDRSFWAYCLLVFPVWPLLLLSACLCVLRWWKRDLPWVLVLVSFNLALSLLLEVSYVEGALLGRSGWAWARVPAALGAMIVAGAGIVAASVGDRWMRGLPRGVRIGRATLPSTVAGAIVLSYVAGAAFFFVGPSLIQPPLSFRSQAIHSAWPLLYATAVGLTVWYVVLRAEIAAFRIRLANPLES